MHDSYRYLIVELERARAELMAVASGLSQDELDRKPVAGGWSAGEVLQHLARTEHGIAIMLQRGIRRLRAESGARMAATRELPTRFVDAGIETGADRIATSPSLEPTHGMQRDDVFASLDRSRASLLDALEAAGDLDLGGLRIPHPRFGELDPYEWLDFLWRHELRHREQMSRALA